MKNLSKEIETIINSEISSINNKISGVVLLEILKYKIIDSLTNLNESKFFENIENHTTETEFEDDYKKIFIKIISCKSDLIYLNSEIKNDCLLICFNNVMTVGLSDNETKKNINFKCIPNTGIILPDNTKCVLKFAKNSVILELKLKDKELKVENSQ